MGKREDELLGFLNNLSIGGTATEEEQDDPLLGFLQGDLTPPAPPPAPQNLGALSPGTPEPQKPSLLSRTLAGIRSLLATPGPEDRVTTLPKESGALGDLPSTLAGAFEGESPSSLTGQLVAGATTGLSEVAQAAEAVSEFIPRRIAEQLGGERGEELSRSLKETQLFSKPFTALADVVGESVGDPETVGGAAARFAGHIGGTGLGFGGAAGAGRSLLGAAAKRAPSLLKSRAVRSTLNPSSLGQRIVQDIALTSPLDVGFGLLPKEITIAGAFETLAQSDVGQRFLQEHDLQGAEDLASRMADNTFARVAVEVVAGIGLSSGFHAAGSALRRARPQEGAHVGPEAPRPPEKPSEPPAPIVGDRPGAEVETPGLQPDGSIIISPRDARQPEPRPDVTIEQATALRPRSEEVSLAASKAQREISDPLGAEAVASRRGERGRLPSRGEDIEASNILREASSSAQVLKQITGGEIIRQSPAIVALTAAAALTDPEDQALALAAAAGTGLSGRQLRSIITRLDVGKVLRGTERVPVPEGATVLDVAHVLQARAVKALGRPLGNTPEDTKVIAAALAHETLDAIKTNPEAAAIAEWYKSGVRTSSEVTALIFPEIRGDPIKADQWRLAMAVTSNGAHPNQNAKAAVDAYTRLRQAGKFPEDRRYNGPRAGAIARQFTKYNRLVEEHGVETIHRFLNTEFTVGQMKLLGLGVPDKEAVGETLTGSAIFGSKIGGGFFPNLGGNWDTPTVDRWFMRTWGRLTGTLIPDESAVAGRAGEFRELLRASGIDPGESVEDALLAAREIQRSVNARFNQASREGRPSSSVERTDVELAAKNILEKTGVVDQPGSPALKQQIRHAVRMAVAELKKRGIETDAATLQSLLWYREQDLYGMLAGTRTRKPGNYTDAMVAVARERGINDTEIERALRPRDDALPGGGSGGRGRGEPRGAEVTVEFASGFGRRERGDRLRTAVARRFFPGRVSGEGGRAFVGRAGPQSGLVEEVFSPQARVATALRRSGVSTPPIQRLRSGAEAGQSYHDAIAAAKAAHPNGASVTVYSPEEYAGMKLYLTKDQQAGFALNGDDIVSVFKAHGAPHRGWAFHAMRLAVEEGGRRLDAFDTELPKLYAKNGFEVTGRIRFADEFAEDMGWDYAAYADYNGGRPDVVAMVYTGEVGRTYRPGEGEDFGTDWDAMMAHQRDEVGRNEALPQMERAGFARQELVTDLASAGLGAAAGAAVSEDPVGGATLGAVVAVGGRRAVRASLSPQGTRATPEMAKEFASRAPGEIRRSFEPLTPAQEQAAQAFNAGDFVNLQKFRLDPNGEEELISRVQRAVARDPEAADRTPQTFGDIRRELKNVDVDDVIDIVARGKAATSVELQALSSQIKENIEGARRISKRVADSTIPDDEKDALLETLAAIDAQNDALIRTFTKARREAGRALGSLRMDVRVNIDDAGALQYFSQKAQRILGQKNEPFSTFQQQKLEELIAKKDADGLQSFLDGLLVASATTKLQTLMKAGWLSNPAARLADLVGNSGSLLLETAKDPVALLGDAMISHYVEAVGGTAIRTRAGLTEYRALQEAAARGARRGIAQWKQRIDPRRGGVDDTGLLTKLDQPRRITYNTATVGGKLAQTYTDFVFGTVGAADAPFKLAAFDRAIEELARVLAPQVGRSVEDLRANPSVFMSNMARDLAEAVVFQNRGALAESIGGLKRKATGTPLQFPVEGVLLPFVKTPANVATRAVEYSPLGLLSGLNNMRRVIRQARGGTEDFDMLFRHQREAVDRVARGVVGSSLGAATLAGLYFSQNFVMMNAHPATLDSGPYGDARLKELWKLTGAIPNSVRAFGRFWSAERMAPFGTSMMFGSYLHEAFTNPQAEPLGILAQALFGIPVRIGAEQSPTENLESLEATTSSFAAQQLLRRTVQGAVPASSLLRRVAQGTDPVVRQVRSTEDAFLSIIPGARRLLDPALDVFGQERQAPRGLWASLLDPFYGGRRLNDGDPVVQELESLNTAPGAWNLRDFEDEAEARSYHRWAGARLHEALGEFFESRDYKALSDESLKRQEAHDFIGTTRSGLKRRWTGMSERRKERELAEVVNR